ncbi:hypothetical protein Y032_0005g2555 [Ancylostoma ceylanicum]|uniref:Uncharacterized protein n=1 Tax=Ancylostoma ceylanicum TaxID=53326 RepID=A0A016VS83_9BILA|nr:hypothetical protein Y032_0005g2555 [Ancylostoma ceylanicum]
MIPAMYLKCLKMVSKPVFRDGVCTNLLEQIYVQRRVSPLISSIGQNKTCSPNVAAVESTWPEGQESASMVDVRKEMVPCL